MIRLIPVTEIPLGKRYQKLQPLIEEFATSSRKIVVVADEGHYKNPKACYSSWWSAVKRAKRDSTITVMRVDDDVYLVKRNT